MLCERMQFEGFLFADVAGCAMTYLVVNPPEVASNFSRDTMWEMLLNDESTDLMIKTNCSNAIRCHSVIMAGASPYLREYIKDFNWYDRREVWIDFNIVCLRLVVQHCYMQRIEVDSDNIIDCMKLSNILQLYYLYNELSSWCGQPRGHLPRFLSTKSPKSPTQNTNAVNKSKQPESELRHIVLEGVHDCENYSVELEVKSEDVKAVVSKTIQSTDAGEQSKQLLSSTRQNKSGMAGSEDATYSKDVSNSGCKSMSKLSGNNKSTPTSCKERLMVPLLTDQEINKLLEVPSDGSTIEFIQPVSVCMQLKTQNAPTMTDVEADMTNQALLKQPFLVDNQTLEQVSSREETLLELASNKVNQLTDLTAQKDPWKENLLLQLSLSKENRLTEQSLGDIKHQADDVSSNKLIGEYYIKRNQPVAKTICNNYQANEHALGEDIQSEGVASSEEIEVIEEASSNEKYSTRKKVAKLGRNQKSRSRRRTKQVLKQLQHQEPDESTKTIPLQDLTSNDKFQQLEGIPHNEEVREEKTQRSKNMLKKSLTNNEKQHQYPGELSNMEDYQSEKTSNKETQQQQKASNIETHQSVKTSIKENKQPDATLKHGTQHMEKTSNKEIQQSVNTSNENTQQSQEILSKATQESHTAANKENTKQHKSSYRENRNSKNTSNKKAQESGETTSKWNQKPEDKSCQETKQEVETQRNMNKSTAEAPKEAMQQLDKVPSRETTQQKKISNTETEQAKKISNIKTNKEPSRETIKQKNISITETEQAKKIINIETKQHNETLKNETKEHNNASNMKSKEVPKTLHMETHQPLTTGDKVNEEIVNTPMKEIKQTKTNNKRQQSEQTLNKTKQLANPPHNAVNISNTETQQGGNITTRMQQKLEKTLCVKPRPINTNPRNDNQPENISKESRQNVEHAPDKQNQQSTIASNSAGIQPLEDTMNDHENPSQGIQPVNTHIAKKVAEWCQLETEKIEMELQLLKNEELQLRRNLVRIERAGYSLSQLTSSQTDKDVLLPIQRSLYVKGKLEDAERVLVRAGEDGDYYFSMSVNDADDYFNRRRDDIRSKINAIQRALEIFHELKDALAQKNNLRHLVDSQSTIAQATELENLTNRCKKSTVQGIQPPRLKYSDERHYLHEDRICSARALLKCTELPQW